MSTQNSRGAPGADRPLAGILHMVGAAFALSGIDVLAKFAVTGIPVVQMLALRSAFVMLVLLPYFLRAGGLALFRTGQARLHLARLVFMFFSILAFFHALSLLPLAMVVALGFSTPIFVTALSRPMLGERVDGARWAAVLFGFAGTIVVVNPTMAGFSAIALLPLLSAMGWAMVQLLARKLTRTDSDATILVYLNTGLVVAFGALAPLAWVEIEAAAVGVCFLLGVLMVAAQWLMLRAIRLAPIATVTPFQYLELPLAIAFGWAIWSEWPGPHVFAGAAMIVASGLFVVWTERRRARAPRVAA
jgi:drug/metabolite transporter (DMT)-like permease